jgi:signal transduction histidine kinase
MRALERPVGTTSIRRPLAERLPRRRPKAAWAIAVVAPLLITLVQRAVGPSVPPAGTLFVMLLVVVVVALVGGARPALAAILVSLTAQEVIFTFPYGSLTNREPAQVSVVVAFVLIGGAIGILVDELAWLTTEQAALRRIAALVAGGMPPTELFSAVAQEVAVLLVADTAIVGRLEPDGLLTILARRGRRAAPLVIGERREVQPATALASVVLSARPARTDDGRRAPRSARRGMRRVGLRSDVATPIVVAGQLWGVIEASSSRALFPAHSLHRMLGFTELVATAIANAESRAELAASRARIVRAGDQTRRQVERDLHDGVQQRLVSLALEVRAAQTALPHTATTVRTELSQVVAGLTAALDELREIARGIHPAILSEGGLGPALRTAARRAPIPVVLQVQIRDALPDGVEVAAYYAVFEIVTNTAKHAHASAIDVQVSTSGQALHVLASDDGVGGADPTHGSGLVGLRDRLEALGGTISVRSPRGQGTVVEISLPLDGDRHAGVSQRAEPQSGVSADAPEPVDQAKRTRSVDI